MTGRMATLDYQITTLLFGSGRVVAGLLTETSFFRCCCLRGRSDTGAHIDCCT